MPTNQNKLQQKTLMSYDIPEIPWTKIGIDLFQLDGQDYLIAVDYTTNLYDISQIRDKYSPTVVAHKTYFLQIWDS